MNVQDVETGEIEVEIDDLVCLNPATKFPFFVSDKESVRVIDRFIRIYYTHIHTNLLIHYDNFSLMKKSGSNIDSSI